jgi:glyoxylase-like metal-dependent hydrolase (beta-lactamase superfamily II)/ferredoxin
MADPKAVLLGNVAGNFFVDSTCIDCDLCRQIAPNSFVAAAGFSVVGRPPETSDQLRLAAMALLVCPTASIGTREKMDLGPAIRACPDPIDEDVYFCGYASRDSFGGASYLIVRDEGNVLIDSPRFAGPLVRRLDEMGGVSKMFLSHRDDVADHARFHDRFDCERIIHKADSGGIPAEIRFDGEAPIELGDGLAIIPTPGHTRRHNWYSWPETIRSMERLLNYRFEWVLPGHGRRAHCPFTVMREKVAECVEWMKRVA